MIDVETLKPHNNPFGDKFAKAKGDRYAVTERAAEPLIQSGLVERADASTGTPTKAASKARKPNAATIRTSIKPAPVKPITA